MHRSRWIELRTCDIKFVMMLVNLLPLHLLAVSKSEETAIFGSCFYRYMSVSPVTQNQLIFLDFCSLKVCTNLVCVHKSFALKG